MVYILSRISTHIWNPLDAIKQQCYWRNHWMLRDASLMSLQIFNMHHLFSCWLVGKQWKVNSVSIFPAFTWFLTSEEIGHRVNTVCAYFLQYQYTSTSYILFFCPFLWQQVVTCSQSPTFSRGKWTKMVLFWKHSAQALLFYLLIIWYRISVKVRNSTSRTRKKKRPSPVAKDSVSSENGLSMAFRLAEIRFVRADSKIPVCFHLLISSQYIVHPSATTT